MAMRVYLCLALFLLKLTIGDICNNCWECSTAPICCDCGPDGTSTETPISTTQSIISTTKAMTSTEPGPTFPILTDVTDGVDTTQSMTTSGASTTEEIVIAPTDGDTDDDICAYWTSNRADLFGAAGGAPIGVCIAKWGGAQETSESFMYKCSEDGTTVEYWKWLQTTECDDNVATAVQLPWSFDASLYPDQDIFNCEGDPCAYYIIQDGTAHPDQTCPYDVGTEYTSGENDYATWEHKLILQGCQSFDGQTSQYAKCSEEGGIDVIHFTNPYCDASDTGSYTTPAFASGTLQCNYGTGTAVYCFDDEEEDEPTTTDLPPTNPGASDSGDDNTSSTEEKDPQHCSWGDCSNGQRFKPTFIGVIVFIMIWFRM